MRSLMRRCYDAIVRTTIDISDEAYHIAKTVAREQKRSLGSVVSEFITGQNQPPREGDELQNQETGFPSFRCIRRVTSSDVAALEDE